MNSPSDELRSSQTQKAKASQKLLIFATGSLYCGLPIIGVKRIIRQIPVHGSGLNYVGIAHIGDEDIPVIDLHKKFFKSSRSPESHSKNYLIVAQNSAEEQFGIVVFQSPILIDVPLSQIRTLPASYRQADTLDVASHVTIIEQETKSMTVFLLDCDRLFPGHSNQ